MITEQEAREAASRVCEMVEDRDAGEFGVVTAKRLYGTTDIEMAARSARRDVDRVVTWMCDELSRREAEQAERAKPIDAEWCLANGARQINKSGEVMWAFNAVNMFWQAEYGVSLDGDSYERIYLHEITTRGQLLDLIAALKGGAT